MTFMPVELYARPTHTAVPLVMGGQNLLCVACAGQLKMLLVQNMSNYSDQNREIPAITHHKPLRSHFRNVCCVFYARTAIAAVNHWHAGVSCSIISREYTELTEEATMETDLTEVATMEEEDGDNHPKIRNPPQLWPQRRRRSKSDTFGFRSNVLCRLRLARSGKRSLKDPSKRAFFFIEFFKFTARLPFCFFYLSFS